MATVETGTPLADHPGWATPGCESFDAAEPIDSPPESVAAGGLLPCLPGETPGPKATVGGDRFAGDPGYAAPGTR